jgi:hypothetical protein
LLALQAPPGIWGDVDRNGRVNSADALVVLHHSVGLPTGSADMSLGDVNADSRVTSADALIVLHYSVGLPTGGSRVGTPTTQPGPAPVHLVEDFSTRQVFPADNWWNLDISAAPVDPRSQAMIDWISGRTPQNPTARRTVHPDFGPPPYGIPYVGVGANQPLTPVTFVLYGSQSDPGAPGRPPGYPIPNEARTQPNYIGGGVPGGGSNGDRHLILIDRDRWLLYETWATRWNSSAGRWEAGSGATFDLSTNARRPDGWTSADAAGLAIFPGLVRHDEVAAPDPITHAFRVTIRATNGYVWPASHRAGSTVAAPPMGARLRLKASVNISGYPPEARKIFQAMKSYGLIVADNGSDMFVTGTMDPAWDNEVLNPAFHSLTADDFEVVVLGWGAPGSASP